MTLRKKMHLHKQRSKKITFAVIAFAFIHHITGHAEESQKVLTESELVRLFKSNSISGKGFLAKTKGEEVATMSIQEGFAPRIKANAGRVLSNEKPPTPFQPTLSPIDDYSVSVMQRMPLGISVEGGVFTSQKSALDGRFEDASQVGAKLAVRLELLKNRLGQIDTAQLDIARGRLERTQIEEGLSRKQQELGVRKTFWSLVANQQSWDLSKKLEESARRQLSYAEDRRKVGAADAGEIAKYKSQLQSRQSSLLLFEYERDMLWQGLQKQIKDFSPKDYKFDLTSLAATRSVVGQCLKQVTELRSFDLKHTLLDDIIDKYKTELGNDLKIASSHSAPTLAFIGSTQVTGSNQGYGDAMRDLKEKRKSGQYLGLEFEMPIGGDSRRTETSIIAAKQAGFEAQIEALESELKATFETMDNNLVLLQKALANQIENSQNLSISYRDTQRKFDQGRVPLSIVINEQDALFQSELQELNFQKQIAHALLDYFTVFTEFPCAWNELN